MATDVQPVAVREQTGKQATAEGAVTFFRRVAVPILPAALLLAYLGQCAWFIQSQSFTYDEPVNILSGLEQWRTGQYSGGLALNDHPPLARLLCTLPAINSRFQIRSDLALPSPEALAWQTRPVNALLGAVLGLLLWLAARSIYSTDAANFVLALFAFSPSLIAHFSLAATNDGAMTLMLFATVFQLCRWHRRPSWPQTILLGSVLGGLLIAKASAVPFFGVAIILILVLKPDSIGIRPAEWNWKPALTALVISFLIVWAAYRFHVSKVTLAASNIQVNVAIPKRPNPIIYHRSSAFHISIPVPAYEFVDGLKYQLKHEQGGHNAFLLGRAYVGGSKLYFPIVALLKWPTIVLLLFVAAIPLMLLRRTALPPDLVLWFSFPVLYFAFAEFATLNLGERYILPVYPFVLLFCGSLWQFTRGHRAVLLLLLGALAVHVGDVLRFAPDDLSYFNLFVRPANSYKLLSDSNLDWGEGLIALRGYERAHPNVPIHLAYFGEVDPAIYGIKFAPLMPDERASGTVIVSATHLSGQYLHDPNSYHWVLQYPRTTILNHTLYVFEVPDQVQKP